MGELKATVVRAIARPRLVSTGAEVQVYLAGGGNRAPYFYGGSHYAAGIAQLPRFRAELKWEEDGWTGGVVPTSGRMEFAPSTVAAYNLLADLYYWNDCPITIETGEEGLDGTAPTAWTTELVGTVAGITAADGVIDITIADLSKKLDVPFLTGTFAGTGGIEGAVEALGRTKRKSYGTVYNVEGRLLDKVNAIWEFGDPAYQASQFLAVRDMGRDASPAPTVVAWQGSVAATFTALQAASVVAGSAVVAPSIQCVKWWTTPVGPLTADMVGAGGALVPGAIVDQVLSEFGQARNAASITALATTRNGSSGLHIGDNKTTVAEALDQTLLGVSATWVLDASGVVYVRPIELANSVETLDSLMVSRAKVFPPHRKRRVGYKRNLRQHNDGEIAASLLTVDLVGVVDFATQVGGATKPEESATAGANLVRNGSFLEGMAQWTQTNTAAATGSVVAIDGRKAFKSTWTASGAAASPQRAGRIQTNGAKFLSLGLETRFDSVAYPDVNASLYFYDHTGALISQLHKGGFQDVSGSYVSIPWTRFNHLFVVPAGTFEVLLQVGAVGSGNAGAASYITNVTLAPLVDYASGVGGIGAPDTFAGRGDNLVGNSYFSQGPDGFDGWKRVGSGAQNAAVTRVVGVAGDPAPFYLQSTETINLYAVKSDGAVQQIPLPGGSALQPVYFSLWAGRTAGATQAQIYGGWINAAGAGTGPEINWIFNLNAAWTFHEIAITPPVGAVAFQFQPIIYHPGGAGVIKMTALRVGVTELAATFGADINGISLFDSGGANPSQALPRNEVRTALGTAAAITGQGRFATRDSVGFGDPDLPGFGALAGRSTARFGYEAMRADGSTIVYDADAITSLGTAAAIAGQAAWATYTAGDTPTTYVNRVQNLTTGGRFTSIGNIDNRRMTLLDRADGVTSLTEAAAITALGQAASIASQGAFATYAGTVGSVVNPRSNLFPYPRGVRDGRTAAQIGWVNTAFANGTALSMGNAPSLGGGYYTMYRASTLGEAGTFYPFLDIPFANMAGNPVAVSLNGFSEGTFEPYFVCLGAGDVDLGNATHVLNATTGRWEAVIASVPTGTITIRVVLRFTLPASPSGNYQSVVFWAIKVEAAPAVTPYVDADAQPLSGDRLTGQLTSPKNLPPINAMNQGSRFTGAITYSSAAGDPATATISVGAGSMLLGGESVSYNAMSVNVEGTNGAQPTFYLYVDDPYFSGGSQTLVATTSGSVLFQARNRALIGQVQVTFPYSGGGSGNGSGGGGSGNPIP